MAELVLWLRKNWLSLLLCAIMFAGYKYHQYLVKEAHESGYEDGKKATEQIAESREKKLLEQRLADKNALEQKQQAELALRDNRILELDNAADGMRTELERIARLAGHYTGVKSLAIQPERRSVCLPSCSEKAKTLIEQQQQKLTGITSLE